MKIPDITIDYFMAFENTELEKALKEQEDAINVAWTSVYNAVCNGRQDLAYWDGCPNMRPKYYSFVRYALHASPRMAGYLQMSVMEIRNGKIIPIRDAQFNRATDFLQEMVSFGPTTINFIKLQKNPAR